MQDSSPPAAVRRRFCAADCAAAGGTVRCTGMSEPPAVAKNVYLQVGVAGPRSSP